MRGVATARSSTVAQRLSGAVRANRGFWLGVSGIVLVSAVIELVLVAHYTIDQSDVSAQQIVSDRLAHHPLDAYGGPLNGNLGTIKLGTTYIYPYPAGYFPVLLAIRPLLHLGLSFRTAAAVPNILADAIIAVIVAGHLLSRRGERTALVAAALVGLGPVFVICAGTLGQIDAAATLPGVIGVLLWSRDVRRRALWCGLLIGLSIACKASLVFVVLALLPSTRNRRELVGLLAAAAAVPIVMTAPFLLAHPHDVIGALSANHGLPGFAGWATLVQPSLRHAWLDVQVVDLTGVSQHLLDWQPEIVALGALALLGVLWRRGTDVLPAAAFLWIGLWLVNPNLNFTYFVWGLPILLLAGWLRAALVLQLAVLPAVIELYFTGPGHHPANGLYIAFVVLIQLALVIELGLGFRRLRDSADVRQAAANAQP